MLVLALKVVYAAMLNALNSGIHKLAEDSKISAVDLRKLLLVETRTEKLQKVPDDFYFRISLALRELRDRYEKERRAEILREIEVLKSTALDILRQRTRKIVKLAVLEPEPRKELTSLMSFEERALYRGLCELLLSWENTIVKLLEGE